MSGRRSYPQLEGSANFVCHPHVGFAFQLNLTITTFLVKQYHQLQQSDNSCQRYFLRHEKPSNTVSWRSFVQRVCYVDGRIFTENWKILLNPIDPVLSGKWIITLSNQQISSTNKHLSIFWQNTTIQKLGLPQMIFD